MVKSTKLIFLITAMSILCSVNIFAAHNHKYLKIWDSDEDFHWHPATCHDDAQGDIARHVYTEWEILKESTDTEEGCKFRICTVCKHENLVKLPKLEHVHIYSEDWSSDEFMHWKGTTCGHNDVIKEPGKHSYSQFEITKPATEKEEGTKSRKCSVCEYKFTEEIAINDDAHKWGTDKCELCGKRRDSPGGVVNEKWMAKTGNLKINGKEILKTSEVVVVPKGSFAYIDGEDLYYRVNKYLQTDLTKNGYRLPTEAEWEFSARGGRYDISADFCSVSCRYYDGHYYYNYSDDLGFRVVRSSSK